MKAAEEELRHQKLQAELDQARVNAGKVIFANIVIIVTFVIHVRPFHEYFQYCFKKFD